MWDSERAAGGLVDIVSTSTLFQDLGWPRHIYIYLEVNNMTCLGWDTYDKQSIFLRAGMLATWDEIPLYGCIRRRSIKMSVDNFPNVGPGDSKWVSWSDNQIQNTPNPLFYEGNPDPLIYLFQLYLIPVVRYVTIVNETIVGWHCKVSATDGKHLLRGQAIIDRGLWVVEKSHSVDKSHRMKWHRGLTGILSNYRREFSLL
jgi:hypothetical protein